MKFIKLVILCLTILVLQSCDGKTVNNNEDVVLDNNGTRYQIIILEGCEHYVAVTGRRMSKVDCNCQPVR